MASQAKPGDVTGRQREKLIADNQEALQEAANRMSMISAEAENKLKTEVIDATKPNRQTVIVDDSTVLGKVEDEAETINIRCTETLQNMTYGVENNFNFLAGQKYVVAKDVGEHVIRKGYAILV